MLALSILKQGEDGKGIPNLLCCECSAKLPIKIVGEGASSLSDVIEACTIHS